MKKERNVLAEVRIRHTSKDTYTVKLLGIVFTVTHEKQPATFKHIERLIDKDDLGFSPRLYNEKENY
jgi:hypothetical protein